MTSSSEAASEPWHCVCVLTPRFNMMTLYALLEPLRIANYLSPSQIYSHQFVSADGDSILASNGMPQICEPLPEAPPRNSTIFVFGSWGGESYANPRLMSWLRLLRRSGYQICGIEMGSYILANAGLLTGLTATTHWSYLKGFKEKFSDTRVVEQLFTEDRKIMTCAGGTATFDLALHFIKQYRGEKLAGEIADQIMHHPIRSHETPQRVTHGRGIDTLPTNVRGAVEIIENNIEDPLRVAEIANRLGISQRQLERRFKSNFNCSVARFGQLMRLQHARVLLVTTKLGISEIATASGFSSQSHFNHAFKKCFGRKPSHYRTAWSESDIAPYWPGTLSSFLDSVRTAPET